MDNNTEQPAPLIPIRAEWDADQACWIATNALTGEDIAEASTLAEIELQVSLWANHGDDSALHFSPSYDRGRFLLH